MSDHKLDRIHSDDFVNRVVSDAETDAAMREAKAIIGSWQCQHCFLASMNIWRGEPNPSDAPACCGGELMLPYRITPQTKVEADRNIKIVSRWIDGIEREERESLIAEGNDPEFVWPV